MFSVEIQATSKQPVSTKQTVLVDTLPECEILALKLAAKYYKSNNLMLVHRDNLLYDIYEVFEPVGQLQIKTM